MNSLLEKLKHLAMPLFLMLGALPVETLAQFGPWFPKVLAALAALGYGGERLTRPKT